MAEIDWQKDLAQLSQELPNIHKDLFYYQPRERFHERIQALKVRLHELDTYETVLEIAKIISAIGDAHTTISIPKYRRLPLNCFGFQEGFAITDTLPAFQNLRLQKLVAIEDLPVDEVISRLSSIISHENQSFLMAQLPEYLICAEVLYGLRIIDDLNQVRITLEDDQQVQREVLLPTLPYSEYPSNGEIPDHPSQHRQKKRPLYRQNPHLYYWWKADPARGLLYINYNKCQEMSDYSVAEFSEDLIQELDKNQSIQKIVIDLRNNGGGNSELFRGFLEWLSGCEKLNQPSRIYVIVGRDTFSSALLNAFFLKFYTKAIFIGEPTGGKPNHFGEVRYLSLKSSGLAIRYSTNYYRLVEDEEMPSLMPDVILPVTLADFQEGIDPCMQWISGT